MSSHHSSSVAEPGALAAPLAPPRGPTVPTGRPLRVLIVTANAFLRSTTSTLHAVFTELRPRGLEPVMVFREKGPWQAELEASGVPCYYSPLNVPDKRQPLAAMSEVLTLLRLVQRERIDIIHSNEHEHYPLLRLVARLTGLPTVVTVHFDLDAEWTHWAFKPPYTPGAVLFVSKALHAESVPVMPVNVTRDRLHVHWNAVAMDDFLARGGPAEALRRQWPVGDDTVVIGTASAIRPRKQLDHFIDLIARLRAAGRDVVGVIAGGGRFGDEDYRQKLEALIAERQLRDRCFLVGNIDPVSPFMRAIDIFISTSLQEGLPMSMCEAQASAKPVVTYEAGGIVEAIGDPWSLVPNGQHDQLTAKVMELVDDPARRMQVGRSAERFVRQHFDAPPAAERQLAFYSQVLGRPALATS